MDLFEARNEALKRWPGRAPYIAAPRNWNPIAAVGTFEHSSMGLQAVVRGGGPTLEDAFAAADAAAERAS